MSARRLGIVRPLLVAIAALALVLTGLVAPQAAHATTNQSDNHGKIELYINGHKFVPREARRGSQVKPLKVWSACGLKTSNQHIVRTFSNRAATPHAPKLKKGATYLRCGSSKKWGYRHILEAHGTKQYQSIANLTGDNWRDIADSAINQTLRHPEYQRYQSDNNTWAYAVTLTLRRNGNVIKSKYHSHLVSVSMHKNVITSFPAKKRVKDL